MSSAMTSFLRVSLASSCWILACLAFFDGLGLAAVGEGEVAVLEELFEPVSGTDGGRCRVHRKVGNRDLVDEVPFEDGDLLGDRQSDDVGLFM